MTSIVRSSGPAGRVTRVALVVAFFAAGASANRFAVGKDDPKLKQGLPVAASWFPKEDQSALARAQSGLGQIIAGAEFQQAVASMDAAANADELRQVAESLAVSFPQLVRKAPYFRPNSPQARIEISQAGRPIASSPAIVEGGAPSARTTITITYKDKKGNTITITITY